MNNIHYQDRWETISAEWELTEQVTVTRVINGEGSTETTETTRRFVVLEYTEAVYRVSYNGKSLPIESSTYLFESAAIEDARSFARGLGLDKKSRLVVEAASRKVCREYVEVPEAERRMLGETQKAYSPTGPIEEGEWQVIWSSASQSGENNSD